MARYQRLAPARFHQPPFKPCLRFSRTRLNDDLLDVACVTLPPRWSRAFQRIVTPPVRAFARTHRTGVHLAHIHSLTAKFSRFYREVVGRFRHALTLRGEGTIIWTETATGTR